MTRGKRAAARPLTLANYNGTPEPVSVEDAARWRGSVAWHMTVDDLHLGALLGFWYPVDGDRRP